MIFYSVLFTIAELGDLLTIKWESEQNPIVVWLGQPAYIFKVLLIPAVFLVVAFTIKARQRQLGRLVLLVGCIAGLVGWWSNL